MVHLLDVAVTVHYETVTAKMVLHVEMHDIKYGLGFTYHEFSEIMHRVCAGSCSFNKDYTNGLHPNSDGVRRPPCLFFQFRLPLKHSLSYCADS